MADVTLSDYAVVYNPVLEDYHLDVPLCDVEDGVTHMVCPDCRGTGVCIWHPEFPDKRLDCIRCSTRGRVAISV